MANMEELVLAAEELPAISKALQDLGKFARANKISTIALTDGEVASVKATSKFVICRDPMKHPVASSYCRSLIGCRVYIEQWVAHEPSCPKCRHGDFVPKSFPLTGMDKTVSTGATYGRKLMTGYLSAVRGVKAGERRVGSLLRTIHQPNHEARQRGARNLNPIPYYAAHKMHIYQNEKLGMFGVTHVMAVDGYSKAIVGYATMLVKNNLIIYEDVYRSAVLQYGMWDHIRVDHGKEFYLTLYMQEKLAAYRFNLGRQPYLQTKSTNNHTIERMWPEVNNRVNYPIKAAFVNLLDQEMIDMEDNATRYCVSNLTMEVCKIGIERLAKAWNEHRIPGKGKPNNLAAGGCPKKIDQALLPHASQATDYYQQDLGSSLTRMPSFAMDQFSTEQDKVLAENRFAEYYPDLTTL
ncbi:uncharacterized protein LOC142370724 [Odontesthes bonariensis]|uniref:uncharacterized protein LOC142370724 n=1 Tax=Odontesthes bonariensis TaxID=219752 RepID=UPI003F589EA2